ncbi:MAG: methionine synthase [Acidimicrobiia bacterium]|nr:methionine synthase [Acidimicrobiia bacterium]
MDFLDLARTKIVVFDGGMGTSIQGYDLSVEDDYRGNEGMTEMLCLTRPDVLKEIHASFFEVGCDVVETDSFGSNHVVLNEYDMVEHTFELNETAARIAREVAADFSTRDRPRFVSGSMGPGTRLPSLGQVGFAALEASYTEQAAGLLAGGVDLLQIETAQDLLQVKAAIAGAQAAMRDAGRKVPVIVQVTIEQTGTMLLGSEIGAALVALEPFDVDVIGINCATGPAEMVEHVRHLADRSPKRISVLPNAGLPRLDGKQTVYDLTPEELARWHTTFVRDMGVEIVGGCCGTTPAHLAAVVGAVGGLDPQPRETVPWEPSVASLYSPVSIHQDTSFLVMGERANAQGSKRFRELLEAGDVDGMVAVGREQVREGAHVIDVCVDYTGRDGSVDMAELVSKLATASTLPLMLDSTEWQVIAAGLEHIGGRPIINSVNLEDGPEGRPGQLFPLAKKYGAAVVCLCIDEEGQARDVEWKLRVARRIADLAHEHGVRNEDLIFDALTFPLTTGQEELRRDGLATLEGIRRIKEEVPGCFTTLGVSNVSFGLKPAARVVLNSMFLHEAVKAGLDSAIVNAKKILPLHKIDDEHRRICLDLIHDRRGADGLDGSAPADYDPLKALLAAFEDVTTATTTVDDLAGLAVDERLKRRIVDGLREGIEADLDAALTERPALEIVNDWLLDGMAVVGDLFGRGEMQLPFVLESAETMKTAVAYLEPHMDRVEGQAKGRIVLATVKGDVHDIGKNLVDIILTNNGYEVHNIGIKQPLAPILQKAREVGADAVGMSGLLVKSTLVMRENLEELNELDSFDEFPVLLGGAALTRKYVEHDLREVFKGRVFYCKDAFEGLDTVGTLVSGDFDAEFGRVPAGAGSGAVDPESLGPLVFSTERSDVEADAEVFEPPFEGSRVIKGLPLEDVVEWLNQTALFRNQWRYVPGAMSAAEYEAQLEDEVRPLLREWLQRVKTDQILQPAVVYGYFRAASEGNEVVVYRPDSTEEWLRLEFPRQPDERHLCIADFVRPVGDALPDWIGLVVVTMGRRASEVTSDLFASNEYKDYLHLHGLSVEMAEALMEYWHRRMREEWGFAEADKADLASIFRQGYRGGRYSWGYPACPDLAEQVKVSELLDPGRIGVELSDEFQWAPEQSTAAIVLPHPEAKYFVVRDPRTGKLLRQ